MRKICQIVNFLLKMIKVEIAGLTGDRLQVGIFSSL
jgi:hypothetical protein